MLLTFNHDKKLYAQKAKHN